VHRVNDVSVIEQEFGDLGRYADCPPYWVPRPAEADPLIASLKEATVRVIGRSAGGREIIAIEYGEREPLDAPCRSLQSALGATVSNPDPTDIFPAAFYGSARRRRPVVVFQGGIHGGELTGTVACFNLCRIIEDGVDLRGRAWPELQKLARDTRILIIPWLNADGVARWPIANTSGCPRKLYSRCTQGVSADGRQYTYPAVKSIFPIPPEDTAYMGTYYNDAGVNLQYDFCTSVRQPETVAWMDYYLDERPDGIVIWHCNAGSLISEPSYFLPEGHQLELARMGGALRARLLREGYRPGRMSWAGLAGLGTPFIEQMSATYHVCGGMPVMCELPAGCEPTSCDDMLDIGLITIEEILAYAHSDGLRPYELWEKVKKALP
jgi:hypothetical protein